MRTIFMFPCTVLWIRILDLRCECSFLASSGIVCRTLNCALWAPIHSLLLVAVLWSCSIAKFLMRLPLQLMLQYDPSRRITAKAALTHRFFKDLDLTTVPARYDSVNRWAHWRWLADFIIILYSYFMHKLYIYLLEICLIRLLWHSSIFCLSLHTPLLYLYSPALTSAA